MVFGTFETDPIHLPLLLGSAAGKSVTDLDKYVQK